MWGGVGLSDRDTIDLSVCPLVMLTKETISIPQIFGRRDRKNYSIGVINTYRVSTLFFIPKCHNKLMRSRIH